MNTCTHEEAAGLNGKHEGMYRCQDISETAVVSVRRDDFCGREELMDECRVGNFLCTMSRDWVGDINGPDALRKLEEPLEKGSLKVPVYGYLHGSLALSTRSFRCPWDSGCAGYYVITAEEIQSAWGSSKDSKKSALKYIESRIKEIDDVINGRVWGYTIDSQTGEDIDSCWGFIGDDDSVLEAMKHNVEEVYHARLERAWRDRYE